MYQEKLDYLIDVRNQFRDAMTALAETVGQPKGGRTFSEVYDILRCFDEMSDYVSDFNLDGPVFDMLQGAFFDELSLVLKEKGPQVDFLASA